ncbi:MAG: hypothetical protein ABIU20_05875 [Blastocatellia bacterium]
MKKKSATPSSLKHKIRARRHIPVALLTVEMTVKAVKQQRPPLGGQIYDDGSIFVCVGMYGIRTLGTEGCSHWRDGFNGHTKVFRIL